MADDSLSYAYIIIYAILVIPTIILLFRHGWPGVFGWSYLFIFMVLRIVGNAMEIQAQNNNNTKQLANASLVSNIGLSPLLLAALGILHEARVYQHPSLNMQREWTLAIAIHASAIVAIILFISGSSALKNLSDATSSDVTLVEIGIILLLLAYMSISIWAVLSLSPDQYELDAPGYDEGSQLLGSVIFSIPLMGIRTFYSVVYVLSRNPAISPISGDVGIRVGLSLVPELIAVLAFLWVGWATRDVMMNVEERLKQRKGRSKKRRSRSRSDGATLVMERRRSRPGSVAVEERRSSRGE